MFDLVHAEFRKSGLTQAELARRMGRRPEVVSRMLGAPGNWRLDTVSDLLFAISGAEAAFTTHYPMAESAPDAGEPPTRCQRSRRPHRCQRHAMVGRKAKRRPAVRSGLAGGHSRRFAGLPFGQHGRGGGARGNRVMAVAHFGGQLDDIAVGVAEID